MTVEIMKKILAAIAVCQHNIVKTFNAKYSDDEDGRRKAEDEPLDVRVDFMNLFVIDAPEDLDEIREIIWECFIDKVPRESLCNCDL